MLPMENITAFQKTLVSQNIKIIEYYEYKLELNKKKHK